MLTPQEVSQHAFAKASFGGYNMAMVDEFLDQLTEDYTALYKENQVLKSKMKVLVDKVEEYRATDDSMRKAFLVAQRSAEDIVAKAEAERESVVRQAAEEVKAKIAALRAEMDNENARLAAAQDATAAYVVKVRELCQRELAYLDALPGVTAPTPTPMDKTAHEIEDSVQKLVEEIPDEEPTMDLDKELEQLRPSCQEDDDEAPRGEGGLYAELLELNVNRRDAEEQKPRRLLEELGLDPRALDGDDESDAEDEPEPGEPTRRIDFENLQFGKDYEIR